MLTAPPIAALATFIGIDLAFWILPLSTSAAAILALLLAWGLRVVFIGPTANEAEAKRLESTAVEDRLLNLRHEQMIVQQPLLDHHARLNLDIADIRRRLCEQKEHLRVIERESRAAQAVIRSRLKTQRKRRELYDMNWRAMRSVDFEKYLTLVFLELGCVVTETKTTGDQGVDLIVEQRGQRLAVQVKGYFNSVGNAAVQEVYAGMVFYNCGRCAVVTNSRFTPSACELAARLGCILIHEENFLDFVMGDTPLFQK